MKLTNLAFLAIPVLACSVGGLHSFSVVDSEKAVQATHQVANVSEAASPDPIEIGQDALQVSITSSTTTDISQAYSVRFSSQVTAYSNQYKNVYMVVDDSSFLGPDAYESFDDIDKRPVFNGYVFLITGNKSNRDIVVPEHLLYGNMFVIKPTLIGGQVVSDKDGQPTSDDSKRDYSRINSILIPSTITTVSDEAFTAVPDTTEFNCIDDSRPESWSEEWTDAANVNWGHEPTEAELKKLTGEIETKRYSTNTYGKGDSYLVGYKSYDEEGNPTEYNKPLLFQYDVYGSDDQFIETRTEELPLYSTGYYDGIGDAIGSLSFNRTVDLTLAVGEKADDTSVRILNIFKAIKDENNKFIPAIDDENYYSIPKLSYANKLDFSDFLSYSTSRVTTFSGYFEVNVDFDRVYGVYEKLKPDIYESNKKDIESGTTVIRYLLQNIDKAYYEITYGDDQGLEHVVEMRIDTPIAYHVLSSDKGNDFGFLIYENNVAPDFSYERLVDIKVFGLYVQLDLYSNTLTSKITKSNVSTRFGGLYLMSDGKANSTYFNLDTMLMVSIICYVAVFAIGTIGLYLYQKRKYRNDEFLRVNPKKFFFKAGKNFLGYGILFLAIVFIVMRWGFMSSGVVAYNPFDPLVIAFSVIGLIFFGFAIKDFVIAIKTKNDRKKIEKLKLNAVTEDDGTK